MSHKRFQSPEIKALGEKNFLLKKLLTEWPTLLVCRRSQQRGEGRMRGALKTSVSSSPQLTSEGTHKQLSGSAFVAQG